MIPIIKADWYLAKALNLVRRIYRETGTLELLGRSLLFLSAEHRQNPLTGEVAVQFMRRACQPDTCFAPVNGTGPPGSSELPSEIASGQVVVITEEVTTDNSGELGRLVETLHHLQENKGGKVLGIGAMRRERKGVKDGYIGKVPIWAVEE